MTMQDLFARYDVPVPRYTSYPTVPQWTDTPAPDVWLASLAAALAEPARALAVYVHMPFCESLCTYCGCNTVITRDHDREQPYLDVILAELDAYRQRVPALGDRGVAELHLGGGTPTFFSADRLAALIDGLADRLPLAGSDGLFEGSIEADPRVTSSEQLRVLHARGFRRVSFGVQDIDDEVQRLVNRRQSWELTTQLYETARALGYTSINLDLIYGLPGQTPASMARLADAVAALRPDRLAVYSFARVPWIKPAQRKFRDDQIPEGAEKRALYEIIRARLLADGYVEIGLDHFARPEDALARAAGTGALHRNFMGYTERRTDALLGLGVSAISETPDCYHQNEKVLPVYERRVRAGELPTLRGHVLTPEDRRVGAAILRLMTTFRVRLEAADFDRADADLAALAADGVIEIDGREIRVPSRGRPFLRNIAAALDARMRAAPPARPTHSRAL